MRDLLTRWLEREAGLQLQQLSGAQHERLAKEMAGERSYIARGKGEGFTHILLYMLMFHVNVYIHTQPHLHTQSHFIRSEWGGWVHSALGHPGFLECITRCCSECNCTLSTFHFAISESNIYHVMQGCSGSPHNACISLYVNNIPVMYTGYVGHLP